MASHFARVPPPPEPTGEIAEIRGMLLAVRARVCVADGDPFRRSATLRILDDADRSLVAMFRDWAAPSTG